MIDQNVKANRSGRTRAGSCRETSRPSQPCIASVPIVATAHPAASSGQPKRAEIYRAKQTRVRRRTETRASTLAVIETSRQKSTKSSPSTPCSKFVEKETRSYCDQQLIEIVNIRPVPAEKSEPRRIHKAIWTRIAEDERILRSRPTRPHYGGCLRRRGRTERVATSKRVSVGD